MGGKVTLKTIKAATIVLSLTLLFSARVFAGDLNSDLFSAVKSGDAKLVNTLLAQGAEATTSGFENETVLMAAAEKGNPEIVKALIAKGAKVNERTYYAETALTKAAQGGHTEVVKYLLDHGADARFCERILAVSDNIKPEIVELFKKATPPKSLQEQLVEAVYYGKEKDVLNLLAKGADINAKSPEGTPLFLAMLSENSALAKILIEKGADVKARNAQGQTSLMTVANCGLNDDMHKELGVAKILLDKGVDINAKDNDGNTALMQAILFNNHGLAKLFIERGADVGIKNNKGETALKIAMDQRANDIVKLLSGSKAEIDGGLKQQMFVAIASGDESAVKTLLDKGVDVNTKNEENTTLLMLAVDSKNPEIIKILLAKGAAIGAKNSSDESALTLAVRHNQAEMVRVLLAGGASALDTGYARTRAYVLAQDNPEIFDLIKKAGGVNANEELDMAIVKNNIASVSKLLDQGVDIDIKGDGNYAPLISAAMHDRLEMVKLLFGKGADVNAHDLLGVTALKRAVEQHAMANAYPGFADKNAVNSHVEVIDYLLAKGADVNVQDKEGKTALMEAARWGDTQMAKNLLAKGADANAQDKKGQTALSYVVDGLCKEDLVKALLDKGANPNIKDNSGQTAMALAVKHGFTKIVAILKQSGAQGDLGQQLFLAVHDGQEAAVKDLLAKGADVNAKTDDGETALMRAAGNGYAPIVKLLLEKGADVNAKDGKDETALVKAVEKKHCEVVKILLDRGANPNDKAAGPNGGDPGWPVLYCAADRLDIVNALLAHGADVNLAREVYGETPLMSAVRSGNVEVVKVLLAHGADVNAKSRLNNSILSEASEVGGNPEIVDLLKKAGAKE